MTPGELAVWHTVYAAEWVRLAAIRRMTGSGDDIEHESAHLATSAVDALRRYARIALDPDLAQEAREALR